MEITRIKEKKSLHTFKDSTDFGNVIAIAGLNIFDYFTLFK